jgi:hypothetical protein
MAREKKYKKPTPKSQKDISQEQINPYSTENGNPNNSIPDPKSRAQQLSWKNDTVKPLSIGLEDIDEAIHYYFNEVIKPYVIQNGERIAVPIIYGNAEKWKQIQADGYYRDKNGKIMSPLIVFKRDDLAKNRSIGNKLDANQPNLYTSLTKKYSKRNFYSSFDVLNNIKPETEQYAVIIPDYVNITYSCVIYTYYIEQMNKIVEAINYASDSYWGNPSRFNFNARINSFTNVVEVSDGKDRNVKSNFEIKLNGYIIPDSIQKDMMAINKIPTFNKVVFNFETTFTGSNNPSL